MAVLVASFVCNPLVLAQVKQRSPRACDTTPHGEEVNCEMAPLSPPCERHSLPRHPYIESGTGILNLLYGHSQLAAAGRNALQHQNDHSASYAQASAAGKPTTENGRRQDVVDRGIISLNVARKLVSHYQKNLYPQYPQVYVESRR